MLIPQKIGRTATRILTISVTVWLELSLSFELQEGQLRALNMQLTDATLRCETMDSLGLVGSQVPTWWSHAMERTETVIFACLELGVKQVERIPNKPLRPSKQIVQSQCKPVWLKLACKLRSTLVTDTAGA